MRIALFLLASFATILPANAASETCLLQVDGKTYINGRCPVRHEADGSLYIGTDGERIGGPYFAMVSASPDGTADGYWNEERGATHAQTPLGPMSRSGTCWVNAKARICARR